MDFQEIRKKPSGELKELYLTNLEKLKDLRFKIASKQLKNIREMRNIKKEIARILTVIRGERVKK